MKTISGIIAGAGIMCLFAAAGRADCDIYPLIEIVKMAAVGVTMVGIATLIYERNR